MNLNTDLISYDQNGLEKKIDLFTLIKPEMQNVYIKAFQKDETLLPNVKMMYNDIMKSENVFEIKFNLFYKYLDNIILNKLHDAKDKVFDSYEKEIKDLKEEINNNKKKVIFENQDIDLDNLGSKKINKIDSKNISKIKANRILRILDAIE